MIAHLDMDAFFASIEERDHPWMRGFPIVIGADPKEGKGRGVVSTANYKAREYGIHSALPISQAWQLSEVAKKNGKSAAIFWLPDHQKYAQVSRKVFDIVRRYSPYVVEASIDEAYFEVECRGGQLTAPTTIALKIKTEIFNSQQLTCSVGIGPNKLIAKIASDFQKPNGLTYVSEEGKEKFLDPLPIRKIPGIGPKTEMVLKKFVGVRNSVPLYIRNLKIFSKKQLEDLLGKWGGVLYDKIRGHDDSPLLEEHEQKSLGGQVTFEQDTLDSQILFDTLQNLCENVFHSFLKSGFQGFRTIVLTVRFSDFKTQTRSHTIVGAQNSVPLRKFLYIEFMKLLLPFLDSRRNPQHKKIRLIGVRIEKMI